ncbi:MAG: hypothetical protein ACYS99_00295, partial [Planctomycetota bacterium]
YEAAYGLLGQPFPGGRDPDRWKLVIKELMKKPYGARIKKDRPVDLGEELRLAKDDLIGRVLIHEERVVHAVLMLNYLEIGVDSGPPTNSPELNPGELERREKDGYLTEFEKRWLDWLRKAHGPRTRVPRPGGSRPGSGGGVPPK